MLFTNTWRDTNWVLIFLVLLIPTCLLFCSLLYAAMNRWTTEEHTVSTIMKHHSFLPNPHLICELTIEEKLTLKDMLIKINTASKQFYGCCWIELDTAGFKSFGLVAVFCISVVSNLSCISVCVVGDCSAYIMFCCNLGQLIF